MIENIDQRLMVRFQIEKKKSLIRCIKIINSCLIVRNCVIFGILKYRTMASHCIIKCKLIICFFIKETIYNNVSSFLGRISHRNVDFAFCEPNLENRVCFFNLYVINSKYELKIKANNHKLFTIMRR